MSTIQAEVNTMNNHYQAVTALIFKIEDNEVTAQHIAECKDIILARALGASKTKCALMIKEAKVRLLQ